MSAGVSERVVGLPLDRLFALYLILAGFALAFPARPAAWPVIAAVHLALACMLWPLPAIERRIRSMKRGRSAVRTIADWAPLVIMPVLYTELAVLNRSVHDGRYFDHLIQAWEQSLFRAQPSREWAEAMPELWISEPLHFAYLSYYFIIFAPPLILYLRGRIEEFRFGLFVLMLSFFVHYLFFIYFPVQGPRYLFPPPQGELAGGIFHQLAHRVLEAGSSQGAAFPSSHVGVSFAQTLVLVRFLPRLAPLFAILTVGLAAGAVYGGFHYAIDALAGFALGALAFATAPMLYRRMTMRTDTTAVLAHDA